MLPVEAMAVLQDFRGVHTDCPTGIENAIKDIDGPCTRGEQQCDPQFKVNMCRASDSKGPNDRNGWSVEAGQMPNCKRAKGERAEVG